MDEIRVGDRVRIKRREDWPFPPGYRFDNAEGVVIKWVEHDESGEDFKDFVFVKLDKVEGEGKVYAGNSLMFEAHNLDKL